MSEQNTPQNQEPPFDYKKWLHEMNRQDAQRAHDRNNQFFDKLNEATIKSADAALRAALLINGGAAVSVLAFIGGLASKDRIQLSQLNFVAASLIWFAFGVLAAVVGMALSYFTNYFTCGLSQSFVLKWEAPYFEKGPKTKVWHRAKASFHIAAIMAGLSSLVVFILGMYHVRYAIGRLAQ